MSQKVGLWMIGAQGGVATTVGIGLSALKQNRAPNIGLVSALEPFQKLDLIDWKNIVLGGHEIRKTASIVEAQTLAGASSAIRADLIESAKPDLIEFDLNVRPGIMFNAGQAIENVATPGFVNRFNTPRLAIDQIQADLQQFIDRQQLSRVIVINLASTEPSLDGAELPTGWKGLSDSLDSANCALPTSTLYAIAAMEMGCSYINFTPSQGSNLPAVAELALRQGVCHAGRDGKTGETFLKSVLAPAFQHRNLEILSWVGHNIFGNMDAVILNEPLNKQAKIKSKDQLLEHILGYQPQTLVSIEYIKSLGDWKTAWDHIHFRGFLGTPMIMTFTWQGCDSILAAPLVLDLFRFTELSIRRGECGVLSYLASFFKSPQGTTEYDFQRQFTQLLNWATGACPG
jgi:myo-inositol-1-phosphate synthase